MSGLRIVVSLPDDMTEEEFATLEGAEINIESDIAHELVPFVILHVDEGLIRQRIRTELYEKNPLTAGEFLEAIVEPSARLQLVDNVMHLPMFRSEGDPFTPM